jgi:hypothetical protein
VNNVVNPAALKTILRRFLLVAILLCTSCDRSDYSRFVHATPEYYAKVAEECDGLLLLGPVTGNGDTRQFARQTNSLTQTIKDLRPERIQITKDSVVLVPDTYEIVWRESQNDQGLWILVATHEGHRKQVYSKRKRSAP